MLDPFLTFAPLEHLWTHIFHAPPVVSHVSVRSLACSIPCFNQQLSSDPGPYLSFPHSDHPSFLPVSIILSPRPLVLCLPPSQCRSPLSLV